MLLAVGVGVALTFVLVVRQLNRPRVRPLYRRPGGGWTTIEPDPPLDPVPGALTLHLEGSLYTGNAQPTLDAVVEAARDAVPARAHRRARGARAVHRVTVPMLDGLRSLLEQALATEGFTLRVAGVPPETLEVLRRDRWFVRRAQAAGLVSATVDEAVAQRTGERWTDPRYCRALEGEGDREAQRS